MAFRTDDFSERKKISSPRGLNLFARHWPVRNPKAAVFISHGFSEHLGVYQHVADALNQARLSVFGHDHIGHGQSDGKRVYADSVDEYVEDIVHHCKIMKNDYYPDIPLFIIGHSMGGMIALRTTLNHPEIFKGLVLMGPLIIPGPSFGPIDFRVTSIIAPIPRVFLGLLDKFNPEMTLGGIDYRIVSRDTDVQASMAKDELRWHGGCKVRLLLAFVQCLEDNFNLMSGLKVPFITLHSDSDRLCNVIGSRILVERAFTEDKALIEYPGAGHQLYLDLADTRDPAINATVKWIDGRC